jgi:hypothetical protein
VTPLQQRSSSSPPLRIQLRTSLLIGSLGQHCLRLSNVRLS